MLKGLCQQAKNSPELFCYSFCIALSLSEGMKHTHSSVGLKPWVWGVWGAVVTDLSALFIETPGGLCCYVARIRLCDQVRHHLRLVGSHVFCIHGSGSWSKIWTALGHVPYRRGDYRRLLLTFPDPLLWQTLVVMHVFALMLLYLYPFPAGL